MICFPAVWREQLAGHVFDAQRGVLAEHVIPDGVYQVGFAQPDAAVDEQRIIGVRRGLGHSQGSGVGKAVVAAHHKGVKGIFRIQVGVFRGLFFQCRAGPVLFRLGRGEDFRLHGPSRHFAQRIADQHGIPRHHEAVIKIRHRFDIKLIVLRA